MGRPGGHSTVVGPTWLSTGCRIGPSSRAGRRPCCPAGRRCGTGPCPTTIWSQWPACHLQGRAGECWPHRQLSPAWWSSLHHWKGRWCPPTWGQRRHCTGTCPAGGQQMSAQCNGLLLHIRVLRRDHSTGLRKIWRHAPWSWQVPRLKQVVILWQPGFNPKGCEFLFVKTCKHVGHPGASSVHTSVCRLRNMQRSTMLHPPTHPLTHPPAYPATHPPPTHPPAHLPTRPLSEWHSPTYPSHSLPPSITCSLKQSHTH